MRYRPLGRTGIQVSVVGMGCWGIGGQWGPVADDEAIRTVYRALDLGVNLFDTADTYGEPPGRSEELLGRALRGRRAQVVIASKVGNWARRQGHPLPYSHPLHVILCCEASLKRLQTDYLDIYQCHIGTLEDPTIFIEAFETLKQQGKIRAYGISTDRPDVLRRFAAAGDCGVCQLNYSLLNLRAEQELLPLCGQLGIGTLIRGPLAQGILAGKFTPETRFTDEVRERWNEGEARANFLRRLEAVERMRPVAGSRPLATVALAFVLAQPHVSAVIPGAKNPAQMETNAAAADLVLSAEELAALRAAAR